MLDVVASLQWAGADVVAAYQFPVEVGTEPGGGIGFGEWYEPPEKRGKGEIRQAIEAEEAAKEAARQADIARREAADRAAEVSDAAIARARREPESLAVLASHELPPIPADQSVTAFITTTVTARPTVAQLDEDAILAATVLLFSRRG
jgi:hypothetical protein